MSNSFLISDLPQPMQALAAELLKCKDIHLPPGETGITSAPSADKVELVGPATDKILALVEAVKQYNPPDTEPPPEPEPDENTPCGLNVDEPSDWGAALIFADRMKHARPWLLGGSWSAAAGIPLDGNGYPLSLPYEGKTVHTLLTRDLAAYPAGRHVCLYDGEGVINFDMDARVVASRPGRIDLDVTPTSNGIHMSITQSAAGNNVRNIRVLMPGAADGDCFYPPFLQRLEKIGVLRFMDWGETNGSSVVRWADRGTPTYFTQNSGRGCAVEYMLELAAMMSADPWICIPHKADDGYIRELGKLIAQKLPQGRKVYIEYSNEVWNGTFPQHAWCADAGIAKGFHQVGAYPGNPSDAGTRLWCAIKFQAYRSGQMFRILLESLRAEQMVKVLAAHAAHADKARVLFESFADPAINGAGGKADAMAIAPYFADGVKSADKTFILDECEKCVYSQTASYTRAHKALADRFAVPLIAYEGGQHLFSSDSAQQAAMREANRDARMGQIYSRMFRAWTDNGGGLFVHFSFCWRPGVSGYWGLLERMDQTSPKWNAFQEFVASLSAAPLELPPVDYGVGCRV